MIRLAAYKGKSIVSNIIKWQTWGDYSHVAIMLSDDEIIEAWQGSDSVRIIKQLGDGHTPGTTVDIYNVPLTPLQESNFRAVALSTVGLEYDYWGIAGFLLRKQFATDDKFFCSELFAHCCKVAGTRYFTHILAHQVSPQRAVLGIFKKIDTIKTL